MPPLPAQSSKHRFHGRPRQSDGLGDDQDGFLAILHHRALDHIDRQSAQDRKRDRGLLEFSGARERLDVAFASRPDARNDSTSASAAA